nr:immunoglobulin light chain junction region [Macaca mulatta]MOX07733.1 immunoglobulin light chain junction region [Macaca mulatta]MOX07962.1 immunoglobulin light chain junction region [Macaca mulatta]MOX08044.1 immunoglobulin light chain junction region [Macaca mulatta]MOX08729.1 immunoglobulin light chain junction region [Macaca mulatta]
CMQGQEFPFSF